MSSEPIADADPNAIPVLKTAAQAAEYVEFLRNMIVNGIDQLKEDPGERAKLVRKMVCSIVILVVQPCIE